MDWSEAERLSIYFEELGAYQYRQNKKTSSSGSTPPATDTVVELELKDEYYDDPDWWKDDEEGM